jgi:hypothetical protein
VKYNRLTRFLEDRPSHDPWRTTFKNVEDILGFTLPNSAYDHQAWWSNFRRSQSLGWLNAGYRTVNVDMKNKKVTFVHQALESADAESRNVKEDASVGELTIAEAKAGLAVKFGVKTSQIEIVIKA